jgi:hypothetical protein
VALGVLAKKITNAFKLHKEAKGDISKLKQDLINDVWNITQDSTPTTSETNTVSQKNETSNKKTINQSKRIGRRYTILTSPKGLTNKTKIKKKTLLGG